VESNIERALQGVERRRPKPVDTVTTEIHGGSFQSRPLRNREELNRTLEVYPFTFAPFPNQTGPWIQAELWHFCGILLPPCDLYQTGLGGPLGRANSHPRSRFWPALRIRSFRKA